MGTCGESFSTHIDRAVQVVEGLCVVRTRLQADREVLQQRRPMRVLETSDVDGGVTEPNRVVEIGADTQFLEQLAHMVAALGQEESAIPSVRQRRATVRHTLRIRLSKHRARNQWTPCVPVMTGNQARGHERTQLLGDAPGISWIDQGGQARTGVQIADASCGIGAETAPEKLGEHRQRSTRWIRRPGGLRNGDQTFELL
ncbi:hypothetical protein AS594_35355 [Streptomyces agglomeratus]|uniref:Uncharacterized protein n=1 Tax=Streptomyces agglomeratus TaxID=285458 RepID=A0A1E5PH81_9ACTN|nr:hypothetical protein AS594_35355 [Streptomyces agglomeratus]